MASPLPLGTLFELPLDAFGQGAGAAGELTAAALQDLQLGSNNGGASLAQAEAEVAGAQTATALVAATPANSGNRHGSPTCIACGIGVNGAPGFTSAEEQRRHFSLDWHRFNVKRRAAGRERVGEAEFAALLEDERQEVGSISGSESEQSDVEEDDVQAAPRGTQTAGPQFAFAAADGKRYACWRPLVAPDRDRATAGPPPSAEQCLAALRSVRQHGGRWAVIMLRGGHFAAAVFSVDPARVADPRRADKFEALAHKSAHRYVVRAGQGGKQSSKDAGGKYARSAGSRLRRYNEAALQRDVTEALGGWQELLAGCTLIFVHAPSSNWQQLFGGDQPLLDRADTRIRKVPFTTRRPTFSETKRVLRILVTLYLLPHQQAEQSQQQQQQGAADADADAAVTQQRQLQQQQAQQQAQLQAVPELDAAEVAAAEAAAVAEEEVRRKKAEKRARQKAKQKEQRQAEAEASRAAAEEAARQAADDEIGRAAAAVAAKSGKLTAKPPTVSGSAGPGKASGGAAAAPPRLSAKPRANESADVRRARLAAAAEARMKALQEAAKQQQLH